MTRVDGRQADELRPVSFIPDFVDYPEGAVLISMGGTKVLCTATVEPGVPRWKERQGIPGGWVTAEYALLPRSTHARTPRETRGLRGRTQEIRRMIGRSLRAGIDIQQLGARTFTVDCDVLQADGGTRTAAVNGGYVALALALEKLVRQGVLERSVFRSRIAAVSVGLVHGQPLLDLCYAEDSIAEVDINVVMNDRGEYIEVQGTAEAAPFSRLQLEELLTLAYRGIGDVLASQREFIPDTAN